MYINMNSVEKASNREIIRGDNHRGQVSVSIVAFGFLSESRWHKGQVPVIPLNYKTIEPKAKTL